MKALFYCTKEVPYLHKVVEASDYEIGGGFNARVFSSSYAFQEKADETTMNGMVCFSADVERAVELECYDYLQSRTGHYCPVRVESEKAYSQKMTGLSDEAMYAYGNGRNLYAYQIDGAHELERSAKKKAQDYVRMGFAHEDGDELISARLEEQEEGK